MWNSTTPYRTGIPTIIRYLTLICQLLAIFTPIIKEHLEESRHIYVDTLASACTNFLENIEAPRK